MALNFPNNPVDGDTWTDPNSIEWEFEGYGWKEIKVPTLASMSDVSGTPSVGDKLIWDGSSWVPQFKQLTFTELSDVIGTPIPNDYMVSDGADWNMQGSSGHPAFAKLTATTATTETRNAWFYKTFEIEKYDTAGMISADLSRITIQQDGVYHINACVGSNQSNYTLVSSGSTQMRLMIFPLAGGSYYFEDNFDDYFPNRDSGIYQTQQTKVLNLLVGDYIRLYMINTSTQPLTNTNSYMSAYKLSEPI